MTRTSVVSKLVPLASGNPFAPLDAPINLKRRLVSFEYEDVLNYVLDGFSQGRGSAKRDFAQSFDK